MADVAKFYIVEEKISSEGGWISTWGGEGGGIYNDYDVAMKALYADDSCEDKTLYEGRFENGKLKAVTVIDAVRYRSGPLFSYIHDEGLLNRQKVLLEQE